jgi:peroxiredoxin
MVCFNDYQGLIQKFMIKSIGFKFLLVWSLFFQSNISLIAQKHFNVIVNLPKVIDKEKVEFWLGNGKVVEKIKTHPTPMGQLILKGDYYSLYAAIELQYPPEGSIKGFRNTFFVQEKPAVITFRQSDSLNYPFKNYSLENAIDFKEEKKELEEYSAHERKKAMDYEVKYQDIIFNGGDTAIRNYYFRVIMKTLGMKELEYIINNPNSYYSFYSFRTGVVGRGILPADSLLLAFNSFPDKFRYSDEGNYLHEFIIGLLSIKKGDSAIDFKAKDINKKNIQLFQFKSKKYVLLHFWATWCTPCMKELPALKEVSNYYKSKDLQIISIALKSSNYTETIKKYKMDWIHIYNNLDILNKYGNMPTPRICLIDKNGKLVYDKIGLGKNDDYQLKELRQILKKIIN